MPKTKEEILADFYLKTGAEPVKGKEQNAIRPLYEAIENMLLVDNGQKRSIVGSPGKEHSNTINPALLMLLQNQGFKIHKNANEVMHSTNTGFGEELIPTTILQNNIYDLAYTFGQLLPMLPGYHGNAMNKKETVPIIGNPKLLQGNSEWTTAAGTIAQGNTKHVTDSVDIEQAPLIGSIDVSKRLLNYSIVDLEALLKTQMAQMTARTLDTVIINGDAETGATGNVNSDDQVPATTFLAAGYASHPTLQFDHGIRELALNNSHDVNAGTLDKTDITALFKKMGKYSTRRSDIELLFENQTYLEAMNLDELVDAAKRGERATLAGGEINSLFGSGVHLPYDMDRTMDDGLINSTGNTKGQILGLYKPAVQYGYGQPVEIDVVKIPGKGISLILTIEFGFTIIYKKAGDTDSVCAVVRNITII